MNSQFLALKITHFVELNRRYQPAKFDLSGLSGTNFTGADGKHPPPPQTLSKGPVLIGLKGHGFHDDNPCKIECGSAMVLPRSLSGVKTMAMWL